ncbi:hypothetical protein LSCM1_01691 [Leishmania martiniquensis]|uniref:LEM3 (Ligand-effect modulator 3) family / CDC50 family n=1 Tax=Leishmania martiniquensis TaxID=1580590 RepID=A0A836GMH8_9TRYP|nr:hypothetical protein LSCM1_01691 [Leishmania martiniquensis]
MPRPSSKPHLRNRLEQQQLPHLYARHSPLPVAVVFFILAVAAIPIGVVVIVSGGQTTRLSYRYDHINSYKFEMGAAGQHAVDFPFNGSVFSAGVKTRLRFSLPYSLAPPVFIQYRLHPLFLNFRQFSISLDFAQLAGGTADLLQECRPFRFPGEVTGNTVAGYYNPCGAYPWSLFNDSISLYRADGTLICDGGAFTTTGASLVAGNQCMKTGIALPKDVNRRFKDPMPIPGRGPMWSAGGDPTSPDPYLREGYYFGEPGHKIPSSRDEDLMVWLDASFTSDVTKDYRIVTVSLPAGEYYFDITERYPTAAYTTEKFVQLSTRTWIGERNHLLGAILIVMGSSAFLMAVALLTLQYFITPMYMK